ncbi:MAG: hypothetical protein JNG90_09970 [Planctomycetaceae bacterium]|nr:hypothetical protein [Planctomycetaceae bacterium]
MTSNSILLKRAEAYAESKGAEILGKERLGHGNDGTVWKSSRLSAVKACIHRDRYQNELECYVRLKHAGVRRIGAFDVPFLEDFDDNLMVIEMSIVSPPFLLDFGKVHIDSPPPYWGDPQVMANWHTEKRELFGEEKWRVVQGLVRHLQHVHRIYYIDPNPGNIRFGDEDDAVL